MAQSSGLRRGWPAISAVPAVMVSQCSQFCSAAVGASGSATQGKPAGTPGSCWSQVSSLPAYQNLMPAGLAGAGAGAAARAVAGAASAAGAGATAGARATMGEGAGLRKLAGSTDALG